MSDRFRRSIIAHDAVIVDAMRSLHESGTQIVLVVDRDGRLEGILTDGDLRRALLGGQTLQSPVHPHMRRDALTVSPDAGRVEVVELMQARRISQVPVVDDAGRLLGLHLLHELLSVEERPNWAVVMAGGKGTRLQPLTESVPKPMIPVAGRPILERIVLHLVGFGIRRIYLSVNYMAGVIEEHFGDGSKFGCRVEYLRERQPLGTAGALSMLSARPEHPLVVMNGDLVTQANIGALIRAHESGDQLVTMAVHGHHHQIPYGCVDVDAGRVVALREKPTCSHLVNAGIYVVSPAVIDLLEPEQACSMPMLVERAMARGAVRACEVGGDWIDVGHREQLDRARGRS